MKKITFLSIILFAQISFWAFSEEFIINIIVKGLNNNKGVVRIALYDSQEAFPSKLEVAIKTATVVIQNQQAQIEFKLDAPGIFAVSVYHDENNNGKMDRGLFGIPVEAYAFSNNARSFMGPPSFKDASFCLTSINKIIIINMK